MPGAADREAEASGSPTPHRRSVLRRAALVLGGLLALLVLVVAYQAFRTALALRAAEADAQHVRTQLGRQDVSGATRTVRDLAAHSRTAHHHTDNVLWDALGVLPWVGDDVRAVQTVSAVLDDTAHRGLPPALELYDAVGGKDLRAADGRFDLAAIERLAPRFARLATVLERGDRRIAAIDADHLVGPLRGRVAHAQEQLATVTSATRAGATATRLMPAMLGSDGPRTYLLVVQNNAEVRATGGLPGALSLLRVRDGRVSLGAQLSTDDFRVGRTPALPLTTQERELYGENLGTDLRDMNLTPDFPRAAALFRAELRRTQGVDVDGVLAVDPVALAGVLKATGPVQIGTETLSTDDVLRKLLNEVYVRFKANRAQNAYFAQAARGVFDALVTKPLDQRAVVTEVAEAARQRRVLVWSTRPAEQVQLRGTAVSGAIPSSASGPQVGMYLNDGTAGKIEYYLDYTASLDAVGCTDRGAQDLRARMRLSSSVPADPSRLPRWITGYGGHAAKGDMRVNLRLYAPAGGRLTGLSVDGRATRIAQGEHDGRQVSVVPLLLHPGQHLDVVATVRTRAGDSRDAVLQWTPGMRWQSNQAVARSACR